jgi:Holliday junction DNA helicase RuvA
MFNSLTGKITYKLGMSLMIQTGGVEWDITVPATDLAELPEKGEEARVWTYLVHREDSMSLFGFASEAGRGTFLELLKVEGIGPKAAVKIMSGITRAELASALETGDLARLESVPGLGKKTAQKMLHAMKGKLVKHGEADAAPFADIIKALSDMGYDRKKAAQAVERAGTLRAGGEADAGDVEAAIFKKALLYLANAS